MAKGQGRPIVVWHQIIAILVLVVVTACGEEANTETPTPPRNTPTAEPTVTQDSTTGGSSAGSQGGEGTVEMQQWDAPPTMQLESGTDYRARMQTNKGEIVVNLLEDEAPIAVNNFVFLSQQDFYQNVPFHRVVSGFVVQAGDPTGTGSGGPGYRFEDEPVSRDYTRGTLAMANAGPDTNGSQFFIVLQDLTGKLPKNYTIFGEVTEGMDAVDAIASVPVEQGPSGERSKPTDDVFIEDITIETQ